MLAQRTLRPLLVAVGFLVSGLFAWLAVRDVDFGAFRSGLADAEWRWLAPAIATLAIGVVLRAVRWRALFVPGARPPLGAITRALLVGYFFNSVLPGRAGEAVRVVSLNEEAGTSRLEALGTTVTDRVCDVVVLLLVLFVAVPWLPHVTWLHGAEALAVAVALGLAALAAVILRFGDRAVFLVLRPFTRTRMGARAGSDRAAANLLNGLAAIYRPRIAVPALALSLAAVLVITVSFWLVMVALRLHLAFGAAVLVMVATNFAMLLPSSPAAVGVFEAAVVVALGAYGVDDSRALAFAVVLHGLNVLPFVLIGLPLVGTQGGRMLRRVRVEPPQEASV